MPRKHVHSGAGGGIAAPGTGHRGAWEGQQKTRGK